MHLRHVVFLFTKQERISLFLICKLRLGKAVTRNFILKRILEFNMNTEGGEYFRFSLLSSNRLILFRINLSNDKNERDHNHMNGHWRINNNASANGHCVHSTLQDILTVEIGVQYILEHFQPAAFQCRSTLLQNPFLCIFQSGFS